MTISKKLTATLVAALFACCMGFALVGCSSTSSSTTSSTSSSTSSSEVKASDVKDVTMQYESVSDAKSDVGKSDVVFLDVRKAADYKIGHITGAISADMDKAKDGDYDDGLSTMKSVISSNNLKDQKVIVICYSGKKYAQAGTNVLAALGYDTSKIYTLEGGMKAWTEAGNTTEASITTSDLTDVTMTQEAIADAANEVGQSGTVFVDVRKAEDYAAGHIEGAVNVDLDSIVSNEDAATAVSAMKKAVSDNSWSDQKLVLCCYSGKRYAQAGTNILSFLGYDMSKVVTLEGGMKAWTEAGNATVQ